MPVTTTAQVVHSLESVTIHLGGAISVTVKTAIQGAPDTFAQYTFAQDETLPHWAELGDPDKNRWEDLCDLLYNLLIDKGYISGNIS